MSVPQKTALKIFYGLPLQGEELDIWSAFQGQGIYDDLGYLTGIRTPVPYQPVEYSTVTMIVGRRGSKTDKFSSFILAYEALCGGHEEFVSSHQDFYCLQVAQDIKTAKANLKQFIKPWLLSSPIGRKEIDVNRETADTIGLKNRALLTVAAPNVKIRSQAIAVCNTDEMTVWPKDAESANPDFEVIKAIRPAMAQFPSRKLVKTGTPWTKEGELWTDSQIGTKGCFKKGDRSGLESFLLLRGTTGLMQNPRVPKAYLKQEKALDAEAFKREYLAEFTDSLTGFLSSSLLREAVDLGVVEREADPSFFYVAALDPAFRKDAFAFTIGHVDPHRGFVQDVVRHWKPATGQTLNPSEILDEISFLLKAYRIPTATSDQYQMESLQQLAVQRGFSIERVNFTAQSKAKIYGNLQQLLNQRRLHLLDNTSTLDELLSLERTLLDTGGVRIKAPTGRHDDLATCLALCAYQSTWMLPSERKQEEHRNPTIHEKIFSHVQRQMEAKRRPSENWWDG